MSLLIKHRKSPGDFKFFSLLDKKQAKTSLVQGLGRVLHLHVGGQVIRTTGEHPFYVQNQGWVTANQLEPGHQLVSHDGQFVWVKEVHDTGLFETVYNIRVAEHHTYFVGATGWGWSVWAHNVSCAEQERLAEIVRAQLTGTSDKQLKVLLSNANFVDTQILKAARLALQAAASEGAAGNHAQEVFYKLLQPIYDALKAHSSPYSIEVEAQILNGQRVVNSPAKHQRIDALLVRIPSQQQRLPLRPKEVLPATGVRIEQVQAQNQLSTQLQQHQAVRGYDVSLAPYYVGEHRNPLFVAVYDPTIGSYPKSPVTQKYTIAFSPVGSSKGFSVSDFRLLAGNFVNNGVIVP